MSASAATPVDRALCQQVGAAPSGPCAAVPFLIRGAVDAVLGKYPPEVVAVYLHAFSEMNTVDWPTLKTMLESDPRLQLGGAS